MRTGRKIFCVDTHTAGEPTRVVVSSLPMLKGETIVEKRDNLKRNFDGIRKILMREPRGHKDMFGAVIVPPCNPQADIGVIFMDTSGYLNMCVHGSIGIVTLAINTGIIEAQEPVTKVVLDTPSGLVYGAAHVEGSLVKSVSVRNVPAFLFQTAELDFPGKGKIPLEIAYGGNFFIIVDAEPLGVSITPESHQQLVALGLSIRDEVNRQFKIQHPEQEQIRSADLVEICGKPSHPKAHCKNAVVFGAGQVDRSPCGTGTCAKMATLCAKGKLALGQEFVNESIIGTLFKGRLLESTKVGDLDAVIPQIEGTAYVTSFSQFILDPSDPLKDGFLL